ncbi:MAG: hypothetical protein ACKOKC_01950 [Chthoniobacterales bacterium]
MPRCETCGFAHAQPDRCINCGNPDPFRRLRAVKLSVVVVCLLVGAIAAYVFYHRYALIERSVREAELAAEQQDVLMPAPVPAEP